MCDWKRRVIGTHTYAEQIRSKTQSPSHRFLVFYLDPRPSIPPAKMASPASPVGHATLSRYNDSWRAESVNGQKRTSYYAQIFLETDDFHIDVYNHYSISRQNRSTEKITNVLA